MKEIRNEENVMQDYKTTQGQPLDTSKELKPLWPVVAITAGLALTVALIAVIVKRKT